MNLCDFCSSPVPAWCYPATSFIDVLGSQSIGEWLACDACNELIEAGDGEKLARRSVATIPTIVMDPKLVLAYCRDLHDRFWPARCGVPAAEMHLNSRRDDRSTTYSRSRRRTQALPAPR